MQSGWGFPLCFLLVSSIIEPTYGAGRQAGTAPTEKGLDNTMKLGIVGLPNVGKSTLFNAITDALAQIENQNYGDAKSTLIAAQQKAEEMYITAQN